MPELTLVDAVNLALARALEEDPNVVVFGEGHLRHLLNSYQKYYNEVRTHLSLRKDAPVPRTVSSSGRVLSIPILGGLHHHYARV